MSGQYQERKEYFKQYREKNKERLQQERHDYYEENKDRIREYAKQWKQGNPSMVWVQKQEYFEKNKEKINEYRRRCMHFLQFVFFTDTRVSVRAAAHIFLPTICFVFIVTQTHYRLSGDWGKKGKGKQILPSLGAVIICNATSLCLLAAHMPTVVEIIVQQLPFFPSPR